MQFNKIITIGNREISEISPVFIIAEAGVNHNGDLELAKKLIDIAVNAKVDAVKFQTFKTESLILNSVEKAPYQKNTTLGTESQYEMLKKLELSQKHNIQLKDYCHNANIIFLTTPFDEDSLEELDILNLPAYKIASTDTTNLPFLKKIAQKGKPMILSTGMSFFSEIEIALQEILKINKDVILLQCTANYPIADDEVNLNVINYFKEKFDILIGYSDHSVGIGAAPFAVPMGVKVVEKHFTYDKNLSGPDHKASLDPGELCDFVNVIRKVETYLGSAIKVPSLDELKTRKSLQKNLVARTEINKGEIFSEENLIAKRTGGIGISPMYYKQLIGKQAGKHYRTNDIIDE